MNTFKRTALILFVSSFLFGAVFRAAPSHAEVSVAGEVSVSSPAGPEVPGIEDPVASFGFNEGVFFAFFGIFMLGLALNLTPCVYPMLAVTVSIFGGSSGGGNRLRVFSRALFYVFGIATMYSILGVAAAFTGGLFGGLLQSKAVLGGIALLFFLLALSMFGLFELRPPSALVNRLGVKNTAGYIGIYLSGLFVGIFAAPCIGPPIIALLTLVGQRGDPLFGFSVFFVLSLGLGFPYLLLGTFSGLISRLPKSGAWMVWVRKFMGVLLVSVGLFYLSLAVDPRIVFILIPAALAAGGIYLGFFETSSASSAVFPWIKRGIGLGLVILAAVIFRSELTPTVEWQSYTDRLAEDSASAGKPAVIYFSADWCIPCLELDRFTFTDEDVMESLSAFTLLKVDLSDYESPVSRRLRKNFGIAGVPTIIFLDGEGREHRGERIVGFISASDLRDVIGRVGDRRAEDTGAVRFPDLQEDEEPSEIFLIADSDWIQPGRPFRAGVLFVMREGWHVYWMNPGDSGMEPQISWSIPEGFSAEDIGWPAPVRFDDPPFATFGHEERLLLAKEITPPEGLEPGSEITIGAEVSWLACLAICIAQEGRAGLTLPVRDEPAPVSVWGAVFAETESLIPVSDPSWRFSAEVEKGEVILYMHPPAGIPGEAVRNSEFFPLEPGLIRTGRYEWARQRQGVYFMRMRLEGSRPAGRVFRGVLVLSERIPGAPHALAVEAEIAD